MNRERLLLVFVVVIFALWFLVMREEPSVTQQVRTQEAKIQPRTVLGSGSTRVKLTPPGTGTFTLVTNERAFARPALPLPRGYDLPNIWPPTSRSVSIDRYGLLRRPGTPSAAGAASLTLPELPATASAAAAGGSKDRVDEWLSFKARSKGRVVEVVAGSRKYAEPAKLPPPGKVAAAKGFYYFLVLLEIDPERAQNEGVTSIRAQLEGAGRLRQKFPEEINDFEIAKDGTQQGFIDGLRAYLRLQKGTYQDRYNAGKKLLEDGVSKNDLVQVRWALEILDEARQFVPAGAQQDLRKILLLMLDAANRLNEQELVLRLAFEHLSRFREEEDVLAYVGNILASRSFGLMEYADEFFELARNSPHAQRRRAEVLIRLGRFSEARSLLEGGRVGSGAEVDLLLARVALALGDLDTTRTRARRHTTGEFAAEANQILGGAAYLEGDAAKAEEHFLNAVTADPGNSTAYSDLGLALAVQGKGADAIECFDRAVKVFSIDNPVMPRLGKAYLKLTAGEIDAASQDLTQLQGDNPRDLLVRFMLAYAKEQSGDLDGAAQLHRSTLEEDHRYRVSIARLGVVQAKRVEGGTSDRARVKEAVAHLSKAVALNPKDAVLPYMLARFLMSQDPDLLAGLNISPRLSEQMFARAQTLQPPAGAEMLPLWSEFARACLLYRDYAIEETRVKAQLNNLLDRIRDIHPPGSTPKDLIKDPVFAAATDGLAIVQETEQKVDKVWEFHTKPRDWKFNAILPMKVSVTNGRLRFTGTVDYKGAGKNFQNVLEHCSASYDDRVGLVGKTFREIVVTGNIPQGTTVDFGIGLVNPGRGRKGPAGIQIKRKARTGTAEVRLDGGEHQIWKQIKTTAYVDMTKVSWPTGDFKIHIKLERATKDRKQQGHFRLILNDTNVFETQLDVRTERSAIFGRGRSNQKIFVYVWVEGNEGLSIPDITVTKVVLTKAKK